jgi:hypothetical protein
LCWDLVCFRVRLVDEILGCPAVDEGRCQVFDIVASSYLDFENYLFFSVVLSCVGYDIWRFFWGSYSLCDSVFPRVAVALAYSRGFSFPDGSALAGAGVSSVSS